MKQDKTQLNNSENEFSNIEDKQLDKTNTETNNMTFKNNGFSLGSEGNLTINNFNITLISM